MRARRLLPLALLGLALPAAAVEYGKVLPEKSQITFTSRQMGVPVSGKFGRFAAQVAFDPARPEAGKATIEIELASIDAGSAEADEEVVGKNWFQTKAFPSARFVSTSVKPLGGGRYEVRGPLTLRGHTQDVTAPFAFKTDGQLAVLDGTFVLKRLDFGVGQGAWGDTDTVANEVQVGFRFVVAPASPGGAK
ncbi:MAG: YceI family protein [Zoogloeaceae bacterium]|nr:YceI family protein [Zoogloeaceae bacterium]